MAVFVLMFKEQEDEYRVIYRYGPNEGAMGRIEYDKKKNVINQLDPIQSEEFADEFFFKRAGRRLAKMSMEGPSRFLDRTTIES
ncbi:hypothetical protein [Priestia koreensis]|uniref:hypothetical protein n=1 Tax=Priestia koreensis TaxID=284581 RepID=UPI001F563BC1|nr:hypothetical protein [Priestia koreensis]UNL83203.1 hypothetical protein IE339_13485 [Priestia koreensis]